MILVRMLGHFAGFPAEAGIDLCWVTTPIEVKFPRGSGDIRFGEQARPKDEAAAQ